MSTDEYSEAEDGGTQYSQPSVGAAAAPPQPAEAQGSGPEAELIARLKRLVSMKQTKIKVLPPARRSPRVLRGWYPLPPGVAVENM